MAAPRRIKFIYAGGTIGMRAGLAGSLVAPKSDQDFRAACLPTIDEWQRRSPVTVEYEFFTGKDSTNMTPDDWQALHARVLSAQQAGFDAVTLVHGTDTLAYTACALAFGFCGREAGTSALRIPIVMTGAQTPIFEFGSDGVFNLQNLFRTAMAAIELGAADVVVNFGYEVLLGTRALKVSERAFAAFQSPAELGRAGFIDAYGVHLLAHRLHTRSSRPPPEAQSRFGRGVAVVDLGPGAEPEILDGLVKSGAVKVLVLKTPGEGNVCSEGGYSLLPFIRRAAEQYGVPILVASKFLGGAVGRMEYELGRAALDAGAIPCYDTNECAVEVKVRWLLGNNLASSVDAMRRAMATSYAGEVGAPPAAGVQERGR